MKNFYAAAAVFILFAASIGCSDESSSTVKPSQIKLFPTGAVQVSNVAKKRNIQVFIENAETADKEAVISSLSMTDDRGTPLQVVEHQFLTYFKYASAEGNYYFHVWLDAGMLVVGNAALAQKPDVAAVIKAAKDSDNLCRGSQNAVLYSPNYCDALSLSAILSKSLVIDKTGFSLKAAAEAETFQLFSPLDAEYVGYAKSSGVKICGQSSTLLMSDVKREDPFDAQNIFFDAESKVVDSSKLLSFCEKSAGLMDETKLSMSAKTLNMRDLPLLVTAWFEPADAKNTEAPARSFNLVVSPKNAKENKIVRINFDQFLTGAPTAAFTADIQSSPAVFDSIKIDASSSFSPVGGARLPLKYKFTIKPTFVSEIIGSVVANGADPVNGTQLAGMWTDQPIVNAYLPSVGEWAITLVVKDAKGLESEPYSLKIKAVPKGRFYAELIKDRNDASFEFYLVRYRRYGSFAVPAFDYDLVPGGAGSCKNDADCSPNFCSASPKDASLKCTYHPEASHYDTCGENNLNPPWGETAIKDDDPVFVAHWPLYGPQSISVSRPYMGKYRLVVRMTPDTSKKIVKTNPAKVTVNIYAGGEIKSKTLPMYYRVPENDSSPDIPNWKVADVEINEDGDAAVTFIETKDEDCVIPGQCPYANPLNAVLNIPFDPKDKAHPRTIWCDKQGDVECLQ